MNRMAKAARKPASPDLFDLPAPRAAPGRGKPAPRAPRAAGAGEGGYTASHIEVLEGLEPVRRRPGMYIGGTDEKALHHLFAEVIDNAMDEALAGHAHFIEVEVEASGFVTVTDNGRGIPVDPHPKFKNKSALEVIMTTLHAGGKFNSEVYGTSGGLHGVGVSVANALSERMEVEVARGGQLYAQAYRARQAEDRACRSSARSTTAAAPRCASSPTRRSSAPRRQFNPLRLFKMTRAKAYLFGGVEIRWHCDKELLDGADDVPEEATFHFEKGLEDYLKATINGATLVHPDIFSGKSEKPRRPRHGRMGGGLCRRRRPFLILLLQHHPDARRRHPRVGAAQRAHQGHQGSRRAHQPGQARGVRHQRRRDGGAACMLSVFIREPEFQGQTKDRLATNEATRIVENAIKDPFDHWLAANPGAGQQAPRLRRSSAPTSACAASRRRKSRARARRASCACPASSPTAPRPPPRARRSSSSKATRPAAPPSRRATARRRQYCRCAEKSSTSPTPAATSSRRTSS